MSTLRQQELRNLVEGSNGYKIFTPNCLFISRRQREKLLAQLRSRSVGVVSDIVTKADGTVQRVNEGRSARTTDGRNSIIASGEGFARRQEFHDDDDDECSLRSRVDVDAATIKIDKKLSNVLASWSQRPTRTSSYSELHRRRFS